MSSPILPGIVLWLALDHWSAPGWAYGAVGAFMASVAIIWVTRMFTDQVGKADLK